MALHQAAFDLLKTLAPCRLVSLGYPDLLLTEAFDVPEVADADQKRKTHGWTGKVYETGAVFEQIGVDATYVDSHSHTGQEWIVDLNNDLWPDDAILGEFDALLDPGTLEHCFNIGQAFCNVRNLVRPGGHILHINPANIINHGLYNLSPTLYFDWYSHHDDVIKLAAMMDATKPELSAPTIQSKRAILGFQCLNLFLVQRSDVATLSRGWCIQAKYRKK